MNIREVAQKDADDWNAQNPIGTVVKYFVRPGAVGIRMRTTTAAYVSANNYAVVRLTDRSMPVPIRSVVAAD